MKRVIVILFVFFSSLPSFSQNSEEYIEVIVSDTLQADPEEITYTIYCFDDEESTEITEKKQQKQNTKEKITIEETPTIRIRAIIIKSGIDTLPASLLTFQNEMFIGRYKNVFNLHFTSKEKLTRFVSDIKDIRGATGFISDKRSSRMEALAQQLTARMLKKGLTDATTIAGQSGKKLGKIIQIKEESSDEVAGGWTMYPPLSALAQANYGDISGKIILARKLVIRYLWE